VENEKKQFIPYFSLSRFPKTLSLSLSMLIFFSFFCVCITSEYRKKGGFGGTKEGGDVFLKGASRRRKCGKRRGRQKVVPLPRRRESFLAGGVLKHRPQVSLFFSRHARDSPLGMHAIGQYG
jgi:hypothetical protein